VTGPSARVARIARIAGIGADLREAIADYGRHLVIGPPDHIAWATVTALREQGGYHVAIPLCTREEGRSDLTLELRLVRRKDATYDVEILDLHVL
jgi:hypothetical protein